jgi:hypothetical protein
MLMSTLDFDVTAPSHFLSMLQTIINAFLCSSPLSLFVDVTDQNGFLCSNPLQKMLVDVKFFDLNDRPLDRGLLFRGSSVL